MIGGRSVGILALALGITQATAAQRAPTAPPPTAVQEPVPGSELSITLVTFGQGQEVFERFGHNALWLYDTNSGESVAYHWGLFDFNEPNFIMRFLTGDTRYWMGQADWNRLVTFERSTGREVTLQHLNLTPPQALALRDYVRWNARDENKFYRYDYFADNCSTRLRDALDHALDGALKRATDTVLTNLTYRRESVRLTDGDKPIQIGIDIALGRLADEPLTAWQSFFIPMRLRDAVRGIRVPQQNGDSIPLIDRETKLPPLGGTTPLLEASVAPRLGIGLGIVGILVAAIVVALRVAMIRKRAAVWPLAILGSVWSLLCGVIGVILLLAWFATRHVFWSSNENVLLFTPLSLVLVPLIPMALLSGSAERTARLTGALIAVLALLAMVMAVTPGGQENRAIVALVVPVHLALAWALSLPRDTANFT